MNILEVADLRTGFGPNQVLHSVDLSLRDQTIGVLFGLNGAGKSVTLKTISGLQPAWKGSVRLAGAELGGMETEDRIRAGLGYVPQSKAVFPALSVDENLQLGGARLRRDKKRRFANAERVYSVYPILAQRRGDLAGSLSGGHQALLAVGRALMSDPRLLLIDEPSAGLSPNMIDELASTLAQVRESGTSLLLVEQNVGFALRLADHVFVLEKGRVVYQREAKRLSRDELASLLGIGDLLSRPRRRGPAKRRAGRKTGRRKPESVVRTARRAKRP